MFLNENEENLKEAEKSEEEFMNESVSNNSIKMMNAFFTSNKVLLELPELNVRLRRLQNNVLLTKQVTKLVSLIKIYN